ncbi:MAG: HDOD domain-containing protein [Woeseiaceae bacterium]
MSADEQASFMQGLAEALNSKEIALPSFPDVVVQIRTALEDPTCTAERLATVAKTDPVLVSRLLKSVNSAFHNRAGIEIVDLGLAISRLGFEAVRNTAITLAVEQIFDASQHQGLKARLKVLWNNSIELSSMCYTLAHRSRKVNADNAFLCGLLHEVGKLYILTKAQDYPNFLGNDESLDQVMEQWSPSVGQSIVQAWGFPDEIAETMDAINAADSQVASDPSMVDVVAASQLLVEGAEAALAGASRHASIDRLDITSENYDTVAETYDMHAMSMRQSISG